MPIVIPCLCKAQTHLKVEVLQLEGTTHLKMEVLQLDGTTHLKVKVMQLEGTNTFEGGGSAT